MEAGRPAPSHPSLELVRLTEAFVSPDGDIIYLVVPVLDDDPPNGGTLQVALSQPAVVLWRGDDPPYLVTGVSAALAQQIRTASQAAILETGTDGVVHAYRLMILPQD